MGAMLRENSGWADAAAASSDEEEVEVVGDNELCQSKSELLAPMTSSYRSSSTSTALAVTASVEIQNVSRRRPGCPRSTTLSYTPQRTRSIALPHTRDTPTCERRNLATSPLRMR